MNGAAHLKAVWPSNSLSLSRAQDKVFLLKMLLLAPLLLTNGSLSHRKRNNLMTCGQLKGMSAVSRALCEERELCRSTD